MHLSSGLCRLPDDMHGFNLLSFGDDPILLLPVLMLTLGEQEVAVEVRMRFTRDLEGLSKFFALATDNDSEGRKAENVVLKGQLAGELEAREKTAVELADLRGSSVEFEKARLDVAALKNQLASNLEIHQQAAAELADLRRASAELEKARLIVAAHLETKTAEVQFLETRLAAITAREGTTASQLKILNTDLEVLQTQLSEATTRGEADVALRIAKERELAAASHAISQLQAEMQRVVSDRLSLEASAKELQASSIADRKVFQETLQAKSEEMMKVMSDNRINIESLYAQNAEIRRLENDNRVTGQIVAELRENLVAAEKWLAELKNRKLVRLSMAIHREKWPI